MIGVFDSGAGGLFALAELRRLLPMADITFFADTKNAPYGNKTEEELVHIVTRDIERLIDVGCSTVLMACCTASCIHGCLPDRYKAVSLPIISPTAKAAVSVSKNKKIGILSTEATKKNGAFVREIKKHNPNALTVCHHAPELVKLAESGERDGALSDEGFNTIEKNISAFVDSGIDTLILGCTHFAYFENTIKHILKLNVVNSAREGAVEMYKFASRKEGKTLFLK